MNGLIIGMDLCDSCTHISCQGQETIWSVPTRIGKEPDSDVWRVAEEVPAGYTVTISREGNTYTITNTVSLTPPNLPAPPQDTENTLSPDNVEEPPSVPTEAVTAEPVLPRTGILWWPVIVLLGSGVGFMLIGFILKKSRS